MGRTTEMGKSYMVLHRAFDVRVCVCVCLCVCVCVCTDKYLISLLHDYVL